MTTLLLRLENLMEGTVQKRPSKFIKTPYVADIIPFHDPSLPTVLGHTASLGCCGLVDVGATILMAPVVAKKPNNKNDTEKLKCEYRVYLSVWKDRGNEMVIGIHPKKAEDLVESSL